MFHANLLLHWALLLDKVSFSFVSAERDSGHPEVFSSVLRFFLKKNLFKGNRSHMLFVGNPKCSHETISIRLLFQSYLRPAKLLKIYSITGVLNEFVGIFQKTNSEEHPQIYVFEKNVFQTSIFFLSNFEVLSAMQTCPLSANKI